MNSQSSEVDDNSYSYDANGNRIEAGTVIDADNRLTEDATYTYTYDKNGNRSSRTRKGSNEVTTYTWDYQNRLTEVTIRNASNQIISRSHYAYDTTGRRILKQVAHTESGPWEIDERYIYDGLNLLLVLNANGDVMQSYFSGLSTNEVLAEQTGSTVRWALPNHENSVCDILSTDGQILNHIQYDAYGNILSQTNSGQKMRMGYTGQIHDTETGLSYYNARYYESGTGRFLSLDPLEEGTNWYEYAGNHPTYTIDPTGLCNEEIWSGYGSNYTSNNNLGLNSLNYDFSNLFNLIPSSNITTSANMTTPLSSASLTRPGSSSFSNFLGGISNGLSNWADSIGGYINNTLGNLGNSIANTVSAWGSGLSSAYNTSVLNKTFSSMSVSDLVNSISSSSYSQYGFQQSFYRDMQQVDPVSFPVHSLGYSDVFLSSVQGVLNTANSVTDLPSHTGNFLMTLANAQSSSGPYGYLFSGQNQYSGVTPTWAATAYDYDRYNADQYSYATPPIPTWNWAKGMAADEYGTYEASKFFGGLGLSILGPMATNAIANLFRGGASTSSLAGSNIAVGTGPWTTVGSEGLGASLNMGRNITPITGPMITPGVGYTGGLARESNVVHSPLLQRYLSESGGRWGNAATRTLNHQLATQLENQGYIITGGAGRASEEWFAGVGGGIKGGTFVDITASNGIKIIRIQTINTLVDGVTPTAKEAAAAARIQAKFPNDTLILVPKKK